MPAQKSWGQRNIADPMSQFVENYFSGPIRRNIAEPLSRDLTRGARGVVREMKKPYASYSARGVQYETGYQPPQSVARRPAPPVGPTGPAGPTQDYSQFLPILVAGPRPYPDPISGNMGSIEGYRPPEYYQGLMQNNAELRGRQQAAAQANYDNLVQQQNQARFDAQRTTGNFVSSAMAPRPQTMADRLYGIAMAGGSVQSAVDDGDRLALQPNRFGSAPYTGPRSPEEANARLNQRDLTRAQQMSAMAAQQQAMRQAQALGMQDQLRQEMPQYRPGGILPSGNTMAFQTNNGGIGLIGREQVRAIPGGVANSSFEDRRALVGRLANQNAAAQNEMTATARANAAERKNQSIVSRAAARGLDPRMTPRVAAAMEALGMRVPGTNRPQAAAGAQKPAVVRSDAVPNDINQIQQAEVGLYNSVPFQSLGVESPETMSDTQLENAIITSLDDPGLKPNLPGQTSETLQEALRLRARRTGKKLPPRLQMIADGGVQAYYKYADDMRERDYYNSMYQGVGAM